MTEVENRLSKKEAVEVVEAEVPSGRPWTSSICSLVEEGECIRKKKVRWIFTVGPL